MTDLQVAVDLFLEQPEAFKKALQTRGVSDRETGLGMLPFFKIGDNVIVRSVTFHYVGKIAYIDAE